MNLAPYSHITGGRDVGALGPEKRRSTVHHHRRNGQHGRVSELGDLTHLSKPGEFDTLAEVLKSAKTNQIFYVPGEHDPEDSATWGKINCAGWLTT